MLRLLTATAAGIMVPLLVLARVALGQSAVWHELGPALGGRLDGIVASRTDANLLLVASPGGGVWRTRRGGGDWQPTQNYGLGDYSVFHLEWDRTNPDRLLAVTWSDLYASVDLGDTWTGLTGSGGGPAPLMPPDHGADPKPFAQLRVSRPMEYPVKAVVLWGKPCSGLFYSYDGVNFTQHWPFAGKSSNPDNCLQAIAADDLTGRVYFSTMGLGITEPAHVYVSTCAWTATTPCLTWQLANTNLPAGVTVPSLTWTGVANRIAAAMKPSRGVASTGLFVTLDGSTWAATSPVPDPSWDPRPLAWPGLNQLFLGTVVPYQTTNLGATWSDLWLSNLHPDTRAVFWRTYDALHSYLWTTTDGANTGAAYNITRWDWTLGSAPSGGTEVSYHGLRAWQPYYAAVASQPSPPRTRIFLGSQDNFGLCSDDRGATWKDAGAPPSLGCGDYNSLVFAPSNPNRAYARTCSPGFARTGNAIAATSCSTVSWTEVTPPQGPYPPAFWTRAMTAVHPTDMNRVYFASGRKVAISSDAGNTLSLSADFPGDGAYAVSLYVDSAGSIYAGTMEHGAFLSTDNGASWTPWGLNSPAPRVVMNIAYSSAAGGTFLMATTDGLYRRLPGGTWTLMPAAQPGYTVSDVDVDPGCPNRIYAALGFVGALGVHRGGVLVSTDNGTTWSSITAGLTLHQAPISDIQVDPLNSRYLYAAVYGQGAWEYDRGQTPECPPLIASPTPTITPTQVPTSTSAPTATPTQTPSHTPSRMPTNTAIPTPTDTAIPTHTSTPAPTRIPSTTPTATGTVTSTHTAAPTLVPTLTATHTSTETATPTATATDTTTRNPTGGVSPTETPRSTATSTSSATSPTATTPVVCAGDCNRNGVVTIDELLTLVNVALGNPPGSTCEAGDRNQDGEITIDELVSAVSAALYGCVDSGSVTETVGSAGGILRLGGARVMLPAGALSTAHPLTLTRLDAPPPRGYELYSALFRIASSGLTLDRPMELMLNFVGDWRRAKLFCAGQGESIFKHIDAQYLDPWTIGGWVPGLGTCFVAAAADQSSSNCPEGWGPSRCVVVIPVSGSAAQSVVDGKLDPDPDEYRFSQVPPFADTHLQASGGRIYVTIDRDPTASEGTKLRVFLKGLPASNNLGKVAVVLDHDRFSSAHGNYVTAEDRAYRLDLKTGINRAFVGNVNPQDPLSQPAWTDPPPPHTDCTPPPFPVCSSVSPILPWEAKVGAIQTVHPTSFWKPDYFRIDAEFSITLPKIPVPADGSLAGIGFAVEVRSDWMDSPEHVWAAFPEQATGGPGSDYPAERSVFQTLLFADRPRGTPVSILTWNVKRFTGYQHTQEKMFKLITGADPFDDWQVSSKSIGLAIAGYDVVALQEIWETKQAEIIRAAASAVDPTRPYFMTGPVERVIPKEIMPSLKSVMGDRTGGTYILSRYPISAMGQEAYEQCVGEDCLYPKGFLWARVWLGAPDQEYVECVKDVKEKPLDETDCPMPTGALYLDVVSTHLNAGPELCDHADVKEYVKGKAVQFIENLPTAILCPACAVIRTVVDSDFYCGIRDPETVRRNQLEQLAAFLSKNGLDQRQVVITGDFNINGGDGNEKEYLSAMDALRIRSPFLAANAGEFDTLNPFFADFDWDVDRGDLVHEQFPTGWKPGEIGTNIGSNSQLTDINARYDYILVQAANTKLPTHVIAKGPAPVWQRIWMGPIPGYSPDRFSDHMAVAASLEVVPFQYPPKYHPRWAHSYAFQVTYAVGTGDDGWAGSKEELYARIAWSKYGVINWWKTGNCSTSSSVTWPGDGCLAGWAWSDPQVQTNAPKFHSGGVHLWEDDDSSADDDYGVVATPHGRDGMQMFVDWPNGGMTVRDWTGSFTPHGWTDFLLTDYFPISYCGLDGNPDACMETTIGELQP